MSIINMPFAYNWEIRTPIVDRVMHNQFVEDFFREGSLRISSFSEFHKHPDELRKDGEEGRAAMKIKFPNSNMSAITFNGQEAYVLCGSMRENQPTGESSTLRIKDSIAFSAAIARQIPGFIGGTEGPCIYRENTLYEAQHGHTFTPPNGEEDLDKWSKNQEQMLGLHMRNKFFIKSTRFSNESEYRFIWFCEGSPKPYVEIKCPGAIQFCEHIRV